MLINTKSFSVWGTINEIQSTKTTEKKATIVVGGRKITFEDIYKVTTQNALIALDGNAKHDVDTFAATSPNLGSKDLFNGSVLTQNSSAKVFLPVEFSLSALLYTVNALMQGKSGVRYEVIEFIAELLNSGKVPLFTSVENSQTELVSTLLGQYPYCFSLNGPISSSQAIQSAGLTPISLLEHEALTLLNGEYSYPGFAAFVVLGASRTFKSIDVVSSFSCESVGVPTFAFDADNFDNLRPHRGQMTAASNVRLMLESSGNVNTANSNQNIACFLQIPQVHGPATDLINQAVKIIEVEFNSTQLGPVSQTHTTTLNRTQTQLTVQLILESSQYVIELAQQRVLFLGGNIDNIETITSKFASKLTQDLVLAYNRIFRLSRLLAAELYLSSKKMNISAQSLSTSTSTSTSATTAHSSGETETGEADVAHGGKTTSLEGLTEAQIAKIEAKRKAKADKAAQKAKNKESKKLTAVNEDNLFSSRLGHGSQKVKDQIVKQSIYESLESCFSAFDPYHPGFIAAEGPFCDFAASLLQKLEAGTGGKRKAPKIPKGARDFLPDQMRIREQAFGVIRRVFKRHGAVEIDTPVFELKEVLTGKYGEDSKLIYDLADQGGELLSLRYDLTVPFARFLAMNSFGNIKRYHMAKVYRRDNPAINRGRYREFYQCDFDIAGSYRPMIPDAEVLAVATEILTELPIGDFMIKINHRCILDAVFEISGVPTEKFRPICSAVDKLDKAEWAEVKAEMVDEKGLSPEVADRIGTFVLNKGEPREMWKRLMDSNLFGTHQGALKALEEMNLLFDYLDAMGSLKNISFDMSLARGLDYYTGVIYEAVLTDGVSQLGSIAAGGRYDNLVGMFSSSGQQTPCVGVSIGVERVFTILERKAAESAAAAQHSDIQVYIASIGAGYVPERMKIARLLWKNNIPAEYSHLENPKFKKQLDETLERYIPVMIVFGEDELNRQVVKVKDMKGHVEVEVEYTEESLIRAVLTAGAKPTMANADFGLLDLMR